MAARAKGKAYVYLNGKVAGAVENPLELAAEIRAARRKGMISGEVNVSYSEKLNAVNINTDRGRLRKPYIIVENKQSKFTRELEEKLKSKEINFNWLLRNGIVEYLDAEEEENILAAMTEKDITEKTTHLEVDISAIFGFTINTSPYPEHNSLARHAMLANFTKQAQGLYATNFNQRFDSRSYILFYPQKPIATTAALFRTMASAILYP